MSAVGTPSEWVIRERRSLLISRADDPRGKGAIPAGTGQRSESSIRTPIVSEDEVFGVLSVQSYTPDRYTEDDVELLEIIASLAATAWRNLQLVEERRSADVARALSDMRFRTMFEQSPLSVQISDTSGRTLAVNRAWEEVSLWPIRDNAGDIQEVIVVHHDVTDRLESQTALQRARDELDQRVEERTAELAERSEELAQAEQRFRAIVEASPTPLLLSSVADGTVLYANDRLEDLIGAERGTTSSSSIALPRLERCGRIR